MSSKEALRMEHITKVYPNGVVANNDIMFSADYGEIHALSGENGAGKSTLMKMLFGEEQPTSGDIYINAQKTVLSSSAAAISMGIGMVHQHFMLVPSLTVVENMILGQEPRKGLMIDVKTAARQVSEISQKYNLQVDPKARIADLSVGQKQKVEILKALLHGAKILILDEPTAVLTPQETSALFLELKALKRDGYTIIFISHKLNEISELCDRITIIRRGRTMGTFEVGAVTEQEISRLMVGREVALQPERTPYTLRETLLDIQSLKVLNHIGKVCIDGISLKVKGGEIFGVCGIEGNGQTELVETLSGQNRRYEGSIQFKGEELRGLSVQKLRQMRVSHIPEDRMTVGIAGTLSITENILADKVDQPRFGRFGFLRRREIREYGKQMAQRYQILCKSPDVEVSALSGGNIQKVVLARELSGDPELVIADQPTRGVDVGASEFIHSELLSLRDAGKGILLVSSDLNELLGLSDRLIVLCSGRIVAFFDHTETLKEEDLGQFMLGLKRQSDKEIEAVTQ